MEGLPYQLPPAVSSQKRGPSHKPPIPPGTGQRAAATHSQSPLVGAAAGSSREPTPAVEGNSAEVWPAGSAPTQSTAPPPGTLAPSPKIVSEQITPTIPSPTANNAPLSPYPDSKKEAAPAADATAGEGEGKKKKKSKEDKRKEKEDEKKKMKERKEKEKAEKERLRREKERQEKEKKKGGKKKDKGGGGEAEIGATAAKDSA